MISNKGKPATILAKKQFFKVNDAYENKEILFEMLRIHQI